MVYRSFCAKKMSSVDFDEFSACVSFRPFMFEKETSHFSCAVFVLFQSLRISRRLRVAGLAPCIIHKSGITASYAHPTKNVPNLLQAGFMFAETSVCYSSFLFHTTEFFPFTLGFICYPKKLQMNETNEIFSIFRATCSKNVARNWTF